MLPGNNKKAKYRTGLATFSKGGTRCNRPSARFKKLMESVSSIARVPPYPTMTSKVITMDRPSKAPVKKSITATVRLALPCFMK